MAHDVFVSYSSKDKPTADAVSATLEAAGIRCWIAPRDIAPGADWGESIVTAIEEARVMVLVFSAYANTSVQIKREVERAVHKGLVIIPLRIEDVLPAKSLEYFLSTPHRLDAFTPPLERHLRYLAGVVRQILEGGAAVRPAPPPPLPLHRRRGVLRAGAASVAVLVALGAWLLLRPVPPPSFVGKWQATKVSIDVGPQGVIAVPLADLLAAAFHGPKISASLVVTKLGEYTYDLAAEDHGKVAMSSRRLTFTSAITGSSISASYDLLPPGPFNAAVYPAGGESGDAGLLIDGPDWQVNFAGKPSAGIIGSWRDKNFLIGYDRYTLVLDISAGGTYRLEVLRHEQGLFRAKNGTWTQNPSMGPPHSGSYAFSGPNFVTVTSERNSLTWLRVQ